MTVFVLSLHRTGTQSTHDLLLRSGYHALHWPGKIGGVDYEALIAGEETQHEKVLEKLHPVLEAYSALSDVPFPVLYKILHQHYPDARFIALYRSPYDWVRSIRKHIGQRELDPFEKVQYWTYLTDCPTHITDVSDDRLLAMHVNHYGDLLRYFGGNRCFAMFHLTDPQVGEKICDFLGVPPLKMEHLDVMKACEAELS